MRPLWLRASDAVGALLGLPGGGIAAGIAAGTDAMTVDCWPNAASVQRGGTAPTKLKASGPVWALLGLPSVGIAAGTSAGTVGTVDLWQLQW